MPPTDNATPPKICEFHSPWMNLTEAGAYAKRGRRFLAREVQAGRLRAARVGGRGEYLTRADWLDLWLEALSRPVMVSTRRSGFQQ